MDYTLTFVALLAACIGGGIGHALRRREDAARIALLHAQLLDYLGREWQQMADEGELDTLRLTNAELSKVARRWQERALAAEKWVPRIDYDTGVLNIIASEPVLARDWDNPSEDAVWAHLDAEATDQLLADEHLAQPTQVNDRYDQAILRHSGSLQ